MHWEEAYQRLHSIDCVIGQLSPIISDECHLLKYALGIPLHRLLHLYARGRYRWPLAGCHHDQRLSYGGVSLGVAVGSRDGWSNRVCKVMGLTWLIQRGVLARETRPIGSIVAHGARLRSHLGTPERKSGFQVERLGDVCRKRLAKIVNLLLHLWHGPDRGALLQDTHVPHEEFPSISIQTRIWASDSHLFWLARYALSRSSIPTK
jgi:hypothetical protein